MKPAEATARRRAREAALQMLYQWEVGRTSPGDSILSYWPAQEDAAPLSDEYREFANDAGARHDRAGRGDRCG